MMCDTGNGRTKDVVDAYREAARAAAEQARASYLDLSALLDDSALVADGVHLNDLAYDRLDGHVRWILKRV